MYRLSSVMAILDIFGLKSDSCTKERNRKVQTTHGLCFGVVVIVEAVANSEKRPLGGCSFGRLSFVDSCVESVIAAASLQWRAKVSW